MTITARLSRSLRATVRLVPAGSEPLPLPDAVLFFDGSPLLTFGGEPVEFFPGPTLTSFNDTPLLSFSGHSLSLFP